ncbi:MAG: molybdopterin-dependent oxidoreductase [Nitrospiraceae bacterium]
MGLKPATNPETEAATIELSIDGQTVTARDGVSLYDVIASTGKIIPAMCYHYTFDPFGSCGMCLVMQEGKKAPVRSCTAKAAAGMVIRTSGDDLHQARKKAVEKHLSVHPLDCPVCDADGHCELQDMAFQHGVTNLATAKQKLIPEDTRSLVLDFNMNRCIACGECINICKDVQMIDALQFMKKGGFNQVVAKGDLPLQCEFCGDCLAVCPVGAITNKYSKYLYKPWQMKKTRTTCNYCGDGCQMDVETKDSHVVRVTSQLSWKNKWGDRTQTSKGHGGLCVRGRFGFQFIDSKNRLTRPLVRRDDSLVSAPWLDTMHELVDRLTAIREQHGPRSVAGLITARCTNEELYLFQKLFRGVLGSNQIDSSARYGHVNFVRAMQRALGVSRNTADSEDLTKAKAILLIGSNITETNPVAAIRIKEAIRVYRAQVVAVDSINSNIAKLSSHPTLLKAGTEGWFIQGLVKAVLDRDLVDTDVVNQHPQAFTALKQAVSALSLAKIAELTGVSEERLVEAATLFAESPRSVIVVGEGLLRRSGGYRDVLNLIDLVWVTGKLGQPGCGLIAPVEEANEQGALDMGVAPESLPGPSWITDEAARTRFAKAWSGNESPASLPKIDQGASLVDILERCRNGQIKALYLVGENPLETLPASFNVKAALEKVELLICQDPFLTESGKLADFVLPAATFAEKDGTVTNQEGKVQYVRPTLEPPGESLPDWHIFTALASGLGADWAYESAQDIQHEIMRLLPGYYNLGQPKRVTGNAGPYLSTTYATTVAARYPQLPTAAGPTDKPFRLTMGQVLYHSGKLSLQASGLINLAPNHGRLHMSLEDCARMGVKEGALVRVTSSKGSLVLGVLPSAVIMPGHCFFPEHFNEPPVKDLMSVEIDTVTQVPTFKLTQVFVEKA